jgi:hypothetical protein
MCLEPAGRITAWLNTASGLQNVGQVKLSEDWDRAIIRFADVEASGRADLITWTSTQVLQPCLRMKATDLMIQTQMEVAPSTGPIAALCTRR